MKKIISVLSIILAVVLAVISLCGILPKVQENNRVRKEFSYLNLEGTMPELQYKKNVPIGEMDFEAMDRLFQMGMFEEPNPENPKTVVLSADLNYYDAPNGKVVKKLEKGTAIVINVQDTYVYTRSWSYGLYGYPTYERGWRYAIPFSAEKDQKDTDHSMCYVRTADLISVYETLMKDAEYIGVFEKQYQEANSSLSFDVYCKEYSEQKVTEIDRTLYREHIYMSPDLLKETAAMKDVILLVCAGIFLLIGIGMLISVKKNK